MVLNHGNVDVSLVSEARPQSHAPHRRGTGFQPVASLLANLPPGYGLEARATIQPPRKTERSSEAGLNTAHNALRVTAWLSALAVTLCLTQATAATLPDVTVAAVNGRPSILVGGQPVAMSGYSPMTWDKPYTERAMPRFFPHKLGFYLISVPPIASDFFGTPFWVGDEVSAQALVATTTSSPGYRSVDEPVELALQGDPEARIMIRFGIHEPASWARLHAAEFFVAEDGSRQAARAPYLSR